MGPFSPVRPLRHPTAPRAPFHSSLLRSWSSPHPHRAWYLPRSPALHAPPYAASQAGLYSPPLSFLTLPNLSSVDFLPTSYFSTIPSVLHHPRVVCPPPTTPLPSVAPFLHIAPPTPIMLVTLLKMRWLKMLFNRWKRWSSFKYQALRSKGLVNR